MSSDLATTSADETANLGLEKSSLVSFFAKIALALIGFIGVVFFYRELGPNRYGIYYTVLAVGKIVTQFQGGISAAIKKRVSEVGSNQSEYLGIGILAFVGLIALFTIILGMLSLFEAQISGILRIVGGESAVRRVTNSDMYLISALGIAVALAMFGLVNQFYTGIGNPGMANWMDSLRSLFTLGAQVSLILLGLNEFGLIGGFIIGTVIMAGIVMLRMGVRPAIPSQHVARRTFSFAKWSLPMSLLNNIYSRLDIIIITSMLGASASGVYAPALQLTSPAVMLASGIGAALGIKSSGLSSQGKSIIEHMEKAMTYAGLVSIPMFLGALAIPSALMGVIFGPSAQSGVEVLVALALYHVFQCYIQISASVINGVDRPDLITKIKILVLAINIPLALVLITPYGLVGVILATVITQFIRLVLHYAAVVRIQGNPGMPKEIWEQIVAALIMFGVVEGMTVSGVVSITSVATLVIIISLSSFIYFSVLIIVSDQFKNDIQRVFAELSEIKL